MRQVWHLIDSTCDLGFLPSFLNPDDPRPAREQIDSNYNGAAWQTSGKFNPRTRVYTYPGDPPLLPRAICLFRDEEIVVYMFDLVLIKNKDGSWVIGRLN